MRFLNTKGQEIEFNKNNSTILHASYTLANLSGRNCNQTDRPLKWGEPFIFEEVEGGGQIYGVHSDIYQLFHREIIVDEESQKNIEEEIMSGLFD